jgi:hypothetical protein
VDDVKPADVVFTGLAIYTTHEPCTAPPALRSALTRVPPE